MALSRASALAVLYRWLGELASLAEEPAWSEIVRETTHAVLQRLARAPKSLFAISYDPEASLALVDATTLEPIERDPGASHFAGSHIYCWAYPA